MNSFRFSIGDIVRQDSKRWMVTGHDQFVNKWDGKTCYQYRVSGITKAGKVSKATYLIDEEKAESIQE